MNYRMDAVECDMLVEVGVNVDVLLLDVWVLTCVKWKWVQVV